MVHSRVCPLDAPAPRYASSECDLTFSQLRRRSTNSMSDWFASITDEIGAACVYTAENQLDPEFSSVSGDDVPYGEAVNCPPSPDRSLSCLNNVITRELSPLEKVINSRQYNPKRRAAVGTVSKTKRRGLGKR